MFEGKAPKHFSFPSKFYDFAKCKDKDEASPEGLPTNNFGKELSENIFFCLI